MDNDLKDRRFGEITVAKGFATDADVEDCLRIQEELKTLNMPERIGQIMLKRKILTREQVRTALSAQGHRSISALIEGYKILSKLGQGGMGAVFKAKKVNVDRVVALKILPPKFNEDEAFLKRFTREARLAAQLNHPNIVGCIDTGVSRNHYYIAMEFVEGRTLADELKDHGLLPEPRVLDIARQMSMALRHAHAKGLMHRDIKPGNIIRQEDGVIKLCDMGLAKTVWQNDEDSQITQAGVAVGTPYYISPEQAQGLDAIDHRADIYSLGATLYHLLVGDVPFRASSPAAVLVKHFTEPLIPPREANPAVSPGASRLVEIMMAKKPEGRFQTPDELLEAIQAVLTGAMPPTPEGYDETVYIVEGDSPTLTAALSSVSRSARDIGREVKRWGRNRFFLVAVLLSCVMAATALAVIISSSGGSDPLPSDSGWNTEEDPVRPAPAENKPPAPAETPEKRPDVPDREKPALLKGLASEVDQLREDFDEIRNGIQKLIRKKEKSKKPLSDEDRRLGEKLLKTLSVLDKQLKSYQKDVDKLAPGKDSK